LNVGGPKRISKKSTELAVAIMQNETNRKQATVDVIDGPASHLQHPFLGRILSDSSQSDAVSPSAGRTAHNSFVFGTFEFFDRTGSLTLHLEPDLYVFAYVFLLSVCAGIIFGLAPALQTSRPSLSSTLKEEGSGLGLHISRSRLRDLLVATQAAASVFLLIGAGLLIRGSIRSILLNPGYETKLVTGLDTYFPNGLGYTHEKQLAEIRQLVHELRYAPDVKTVSQGLPPDGGGLRTAAVGLNGLKPSTDKAARTVFYSYVAPNYFECLGIPLVIGHTFWEQSPGRQTTVILSQSAATEFWPGESPIGKRVGLDASNQFHTRGQLMPQGGDDRKACLVLPKDQEDSVPILIHFTSIRKDMSLELGNSTGVPKMIHSLEPSTCSTKTSFVS